MKTVIYAAILFQICGNELVVFEKNQPIMSCHMVTQECREITVQELIIVRQTTHCGKIQVFNLFE
jgi:hypothetical protein